MKYNKLNITIEEAIELYEEHKTLTNVAKYLNAELETLRQFYLNNNIEYNKQVHHKSDEAFFDELTEKSAYWLGFFSADGNVDKKKKRMTVALGIKDLKHLEKFKADLKLESPIRTYIRKEERPEFKKDEYEGCTIRFTSETIYKKLAEYNVVPNKSLTYTIPNIVKNSVNYRHFIRGLIDGDGGIYIRGGHPSICLAGNYMVVDTVLLHLKDYLKLKTETKTRKLKGNVFTFSVSNAEDLHKIINYIYTDTTVYLDRKYTIAREILKFPITRRKSIDKDKLTELFLTIKKRRKLTRKDYAEMAKTLECSPATITRRLEEYGLIRVELRKEQEEWRKQAEICTNDPEIVPTS